MARTDPRSAPAQPLSEPQPEATGDDPPERRQALARLAKLLGGGLCGALLLPGAAFLADPLRRRPPEPEPLPIAAIGEVPDLDAGAAPLRVRVRAPGSIDAWQRHGESAVGAVWLSRQRGELVALSAVCPHAGCAIDYSAAERCFRCPCHDSRFTLAGARQTGPSPRDLDRLPVEERDGKVLCRLVRFRAGVARREAL